MLSIWLTIILLALSWYPLTGFYAPANLHYSSPTWFAVFMLVGAMICGYFISLRAPDGNTVLSFPTTRSRSLLWLAVTALFALNIPLPYALPAYCIFIAIAISMILKSLSKPKHRIFTTLQRLARSFLFCGLILIVQAAVQPFFVVWASRYHHLPWLAKPAAALLSFYGHPTASANGGIELQHVDEIYTFLPSWEVLSHYLVVLVVAGAAMVLFLFRQPKKYYVLLPVILIAYMFMRFIFMMLVYTNNELASDFWRLDLLALSLIPLPFVLHRLLPIVPHPPLPEKREAPNSKTQTPISSSRKQESEGLSSQPSRGRGFENSPIEAKFYDSSLAGGQKGVTNSMTSTQLHTCNRAATVACFAAAILAWSAFFGFSDPGIKKSGKIIIDEKHSNWEWTTEAFDTSWYGEKSTYNYYSLAEYLGYFYHVERNFDALSEDALAQYDILFIKTPTAPFAPSEIVAIKNFVANGGGLLLVGDHTNVFGTATNLNPLASEFGFRFRYDGQYDLEGEQSIYKKPKILPHPTVQHLPPFLFATGCMLEAPLWVENAIIGYGIKSLYLDYSQKNFFPKDARNNPRMEFGLFLQAGGRAFGKGRVFLFTDSTVWSNFYMFIPGKPELLLGIIDWLNRRNRLPDWLRPALAVFGLISLACVFFFTRRLDRQAVITTLLFTGLMVVPLASRAFEMLNRYHYPQPVPHTRFTRVTFESQYSHFELPLFHVTQAVDHSTHTFYVWLQRLGYVPALKSTLAEALQSGDAVVLFRPGKEFTDADLQHIEAFLQHGGKLLVLDDPRAHQFNHTNQLLARLGMAMHNDARAYAKVRLARAAGDTLGATTAYAGAVSGGEPLLWAQILSRSHKNTGANRRSEQDKTQPEVEKQQQRISARQFEPKFEFGNAEEMVDPAQPWPVLAAKKVGNGTLAAMATAALFTDEEMGFTTAQPTANMRRTFELEYWIFRDVLGLGTRE